LICCAIVSYPLKQINHCLSVAFLVSVEHKIKKPVAKNDRVMWKRVETTTVD
jgi:hypothetical protein